MSDYRSVSDINSNLEKLLEQAMPNSNDRRHKEYVEYINGFLQYFGKEKCYLVGSTAEETKLRMSIDNGDADFLFVSGRLTIPVSQIEHRADVPSFVWVRAENLDSDLGIDLIEMEDGKKYLPPESLQIVDPKFFTILRGIYKCVNSTTDSIPGRQTRVTTMGEKSSVGLARTEFRGLKIIDKDKIPKLKKFFPKRLLPRLDSTNSQRACVDKEQTQNILELLALFSTPSNHLNYEGQFAHFTDIVKLLLRRQKEETLNRRGKKPLVSFGDDPEDYSNFQKKHTHTETDDLDIYENDLDLPADVVATYEEKTMKDFVPAFKLDGKLPCMERWFIENGKWLPADTKSKIHDAEIFVVAKSSPFNPDKRDFSLAFNHAEILLAKALSPTQRKCLLAVKAIYKGSLMPIMKSVETTHRLKSFHLKSVLYWVLEETVGSQIWMEENLTEAVGRVLFYLREALHKKTLLHYFTQSNLFAGLETSMCTDLIQGIDDIIQDPNRGLELFFALGKKGDPVITLTNEQVRHLIDMSKDGGVEKEVNVLEEAVEDFERGFEETRCKKGRVPLSEAINHVMNMYLQSEGEKEAKKELKKLRPPAPENLGNLISGVLGSMAGAAFQSAASSSPDQGEERSPNPGNPLAGLAVHLLQSSSDRNRPSSDQTQRALRMSTQQLTERTSSQTSNTPDHGRQLANAVNAFFSSSAQSDQRRALENEVKQLGFSYFLGKLE